MLPGLTQLLAYRQCRRKVAIGVSGGGLPAVAMAIDQGLDAALAFEAGNPFDQRWMDAMDGGFERLLQRWRQEKQTMIKVFVRYSDGGQDHFAGRDNLLVMDLERGDGWPQLCTFLRLDIPKLPFPHANKQRASARA